MIYLIYLAGLVHFGILAASFSVPKVFDWGAHLALLPPFLRKLFWVYGAFIVLIIISFGILTLLHAPAMLAGEPVARSLCGLIACFWGARLIVQWFVFDPKGFLVNRWLRIGYHALTPVFLYLVAVYGWLALFPNNSL